MLGGEALCTSTVSCFLLPPPCTAMSSLLPAPALGLRLACHSHRPVPVSESATFRLLSQHPSHRRSVLSCSLSPHSLAFVLTLVLQKKGEHPDICRFHLIERTQRSSILSVQYYIIKSLGESTNFCFCFCEEGEKEYAGPTSCYCGGVNHNRHRDRVNHKPHHHVNHSRRDRTNQ